MTEEELWYCRKCGSTKDTWFDRMICAEPCGSMHDRCAECGASTGHCPWEEV